MKKIQFLFLFICITNLVYSQSFNDLNQKAIELYKQKKLSECINFGLQALDQCKKENTYTSFNFYLASINLATYYFDSENYYEAISYYKYANLSHISFYGYDKMFFYYVKNHAISLEKIGMMDGAESIYKTGIDISKNKFGDTSKIYFSNLENIAEFYFRKNDYKKSISIFSQLEKSLINKDSENYIVALIYLAKCYYYTNDYEKAIEYFYKSYTYMSLLIKSDPKWPVYLNNYIITCFENTNNIKEAERFLINQIKQKKSLNYFVGYFADLNKLSLLKYNNGEIQNAISIINEHLNDVTKLEKKDSINYATIQNNLGFYYYLLKDSSNSFKHFYIGHNLIKCIYGESSFEYINSTNALGVKYYDYGDVEKAIKLYEEAFQLRNTNFLKMDTGYYYLINNLILCYTQQSDSINISKYKQLLSNYNLITKISQTDVDSLSNLDYAELYNKADSFKIKNNLIEAKKYGDLALKVCRKSKNIDSTNLLSSLFLLANIEFQIGNYNESKKLFQEQNELAKKLFGTLDSYYTASLTLLELTNEQLRNFNEAEKLCKDILSIQKIRFSKIDQEYAKACITYGNYLLKTNRFIEAKNYFLEAGSILRTSKKNQTEEYVSYLNNIGYLYSELNDYKNSIESYDSVIQLYKKIKNVNPSDYIDIYSDIANVYQKTGNYKEGKNYFEKANIVSIKEYGEKSIQHNYFLLNYADFNVKSGNYKDAENEYLNVMISFKINLGTNSEEYLRTLNNLALLYNLIGLNNKSDSLFELSTQLIKKKYGELSEEYAYCLNNIGVNNYQQGEYKKSEKYFLESSKIRKNILGENNSDYASSLLNLGLVNLAIGNYSAALNFTEKASDIFKYKNMEEMYATAINNIGLIYFLKEDNKNAEEKFIESIKIKKNLLGENHPDYIKSLTAFGLYYLSLNQKKLAEKYILQSLTLNKKIYGENSNQYANSMTLLGLLIENVNKSEAEKYLYQSYQIINKNSGHNNLLITSPLTGLNILYEDQHEFQKADSLLIDLVKIYKFLMIKNFEFMSMSQSLEFIKSQERNFSFAYSYLSRNTNSDAVPSLFDMDLFIRNTTLYNLDKLELIAQKNNDTTFLKKWSTYKIYKSILSKSKPEDDTSELLKNTESIEKEIMSELPEYSEAIKNNKINWRDIQNKLKPSDAVISYVSFRYNSNLKFSDSVLYAAFVIRKEWKQPKYISICNESQLAEILEINNNGESIDKFYSDTTNGLYNIIWKPLDSLFTGVNRIYLSPISMLNRISFSAISLPEGGKLIDKYDIHILANVRSIAEVSKNQTELKSAFLFGDIDYNNEPLSIDKNISYQVADSASFSLMRSITNGKWGNLNSTGNEVSTIRNITTGSKINTILFTKQNASEENFKNIKSPSIIHIATHGFSSPQPKQNNKADYFLVETQKNIFQKSVDPLTRSGLVMSGGNQMWLKGIPYPNHEDEILTAKEVSDMDLGGCVLATLSACETGLGDLKGSEGVFGLQRAFKMAGVHYLIVSLWKVPDAETADFMQTFYSKWLKDKNEIKDAFRKTQLEMSDKYKEPYKWAGFVLVE